MGNYPRTLSEFEQQFASEDACRAYVASIRWVMDFDVQGAADRMHGRAAEIFGSAVPASGKPV